MTHDDHQATGAATASDRPEPSAITPSQQPSALERGARIFERPGRKPDGDRRSR